MSNEDIKFLLARYITNQANDEEIAEVKHWVGLHPENELYFVELYEAWQNMLYVKSQNIDDEKAYQLFLAKITPQKPQANPLKWFKVAAVIIFGIGTSALFLYRQPVRPVDKNQIIAEKGAVKKMILADGTVVWLNAGSIIRYDDNFNKTNRTVYLEGEAFFDIGHANKTIPFLVNTKKYTIRDIGTKFNLKAYPNDPFFETTVVKGEVAVESRSETNPHDVNRIYIKPQQLLRIYYHPEKETAKEQVLVTKSYTDVNISQIDSAKLQVYDGWKDDLLVFDGSTLGEIASILERRYNVQITLNDSALEHIQYSGSFKNVPDIEKVLHIIKLNTPINYTIKGQQITITKLTDN